jgi:FRG domain
MASRSKRRERATADPQRANWRGDPAETGEFVDTFTFRLPFRMGISDGAPTRLQDWTRSPFVAAYFAYREDAGKDGALWAIQANFCRRAVTPGAIAIPWDHLGVYEEVYVDADTGAEEARYKVPAMTQADQENACFARPFAVGVDGHCRWCLSTSMLEWQRSRLRFS